MLIPLCGGSASVSVLHSTAISPARSALLIHVLDPSSTYPSLVGRAVEQLGRNHYVPSFGQAVGHVADVAVYPKGFLEQDDAGGRAAGLRVGHIGVHLGAVGYG